MRTYAATVRRELLRHRDGAKTFSGTTLTDPEVVRRQEVTFDTLVRQGFRLPDATLGLVLLHDFTIGFCVEEQAVNQAVAAGEENAPLAVEAGAVIFGDPDTRFTDLVELLLDSVARMRSTG